MNCKELAYMLADYFDGSMDPQLREELDAHIANCEPCMIFTKTYLAVSDKTRQLRKDIEYKIPPDVRIRLETFVRAAALKFPEKVKEYREQVERERQEKVAGLIKAAIGGCLSSITALLVQTHCAACPECKEFFDGLLKAPHPAAGDPPILIDSHVTRLMESLPPGEEFFLA
jgi:predicted anti-sigma-YlaC factor YlaD